MHVGMGVGVLEQQQKPVVVAELSRAFLSEVPYFGDHLGMISCY